MTTCGELLTGLLEAWGIEVVFGIPGVHTVELYRGLPSTRMRHVTPRHEQGAGFMADGYARVTGKPAACFIITGPGMTNIATAMGQAYADSIPMLVISSVDDRRHLGLARGRLHELKAQSDLVAGVAAFSHTVLDPAQLPEVLARAFGVFRSGRPRPVHIELPLDVITADASAIEIATWAVPTRAAPDPAAIADAAQRLQKARRPLLVAGGGAVGAAKQVRDLAERLEAPLFLTVNGRGILSPGHPLALDGQLGMPALRDELAVADVVLVVGSELGETENYAGPVARPAGALIRIDIDPQQLVTGIPATLPIVADARLATEALLGAIWERRPDGEGAERAARLRSAVRDSFWPACNRHERLLALVREALPELILVGDSCEPVYAANQFHQPAHTRSWFNSSTGYGTLGYALPAALGARLGQPARPVVALIGDGGLQFTLPEVAAGVEAGLGIAILVWNNHGYGEIKTYMADRGIPQIGVDIHTPDLCAAVEALGGKAVRPSDASEMRAALGAATRGRVPYVIEIDAASGFGRSLDG